MKNTPLRSRPITPETVVVVSALSEVNAKCVDFCTADQTIVAVLSMKSPTKWLVASRMCSGAVVALHFL